MNKFFALFRFLPSRRPPVFAERSTLATGGVLSGLHGHPLVQKGRRAPDLGSLLRFLLVHIVSRATSACIPSRPGYEGFIPAVPRCTSTPMRPRATTIPSRTSQMRHAPEVINPNSKPPKRLQGGAMTRQVTPARNETLSRCPPQPPASCPIREHRPSLKPRVLLPGAFPLAVSQC